jgi:hypothetical protein
MMDAMTLFKSGKRYRGFVNTEGEVFPSTFNVFPLDSNKVRIKYVFPTTLTPKIKTGTTFYTLIEDQENRIGELRVASIGEKDFGAVLMFVGKDRRRLPRVKVEGILNIDAILERDGVKVAGALRDISLVSASLRTDAELLKGRWRLTVIYRGIKSSFKCNLIRSEKGMSIVEFETSADVVELLSKIYSDLFLKVQRESYS